MDAQQLRKALYDFFKFNPKDFIVKGSATGYLVELARSLVGREKEQYLPPWSCYVSEYDPTTEYITLKINNISRLMKQQGYRTDYSELAWTDAVDPSAIVNFPDNSGAGITLTSPYEVVWLQGHFLSDGTLDYTTLEIMWGAKWSSSLPYQDAAGSPLGSNQAFDTRILLAHFIPSDDDYSKDYLFGGVFYSLQCPVTTHLAEGIVRGRYGTMAEIEDFPAIIPWHGCVFGGS